MWIVEMGFTVGDVETGKARTGLHCETHLKSESEGVHCSVMSNSLGPHGL